MGIQTAFQQFSARTHQMSFSMALVTLRILLGAQLLFAGIEKFGQWSAQGFLETATGPFAGFFQSLAGNMLVDQLNVWGQLFIGTALILGLCTRPAAAFGALMMALYYFAHFEQNTAHGFIEFHVIYLVLFLLFLAGGMGHIFGLDGLVWRNLRKKRAIHAILFG